MYKWMTALCGCVIAVAIGLAVSDTQPSTTRGLVIMNSVDGSPNTSISGGGGGSSGTTDVALNEPRLAANGTAGDVKSSAAPDKPGSGVAHERIVAYYGVAGNSHLGVVGTASADTIATAVARRANSFRGYGEPVRGAIELVATMAQTSPGPHGTYSTSVDAATIRRYLDVVHRHHELLILDLQPGRASFLTQAKALAPFLKDGSVALGLDTEWRITSGSPGGGRVGSTRASEINAVGAYLSKLTKQYHLPTKMLLIHQFRLSMLPDRSHIGQHKGVWVVIHDDGFGTPKAKIDAFNRLHFPRAPFGVGFKVFLHGEPSRMTPRQVMSLNPRPDVITYQ